MSYIAKCDKCGATEDITGHGATALPEDWRQPGIQVKSHLGIKYRYLHFCPRCSNTLGITGGITEETAADTLMGILETVVENAIDARED